MKKFEVVPAPPKLPALPAPAPVEGPLLEVAAAMREVSLTQAMQIDRLVDALSQKQWSRIKVHITRNMAGDMTDLEFTKS